MRVALYLVLLFLAACTIIIYKNLQAIPLKELKRRSRSDHNRKLIAIYKMASYEASLNVLLWIIGICSSVALVVMSVEDSLLITAVIAIIFSWLIFAYKPSSEIKGWSWTLVGFWAPIFSFLLSYLQPILSRFSRPHIAQVNTKLYEKEDLLEFLHAQNNHSSNRIEPSSLRMAFNSLTFGDKTVGSVMTPLRKIRMVKEDEQVGPMLMDDLHKTGFSRFPVSKEGSSSMPEIIGTLYLKEIIGYEGNAKVRELMNKKVFYINEVQGLREALSAFLKTHHHLFIVVNNFEEVVGVLSIEDVIEQILGEQIVDEFDRYDDLRAVAGLEAKKQHDQHEHAEAKA